MNNIVVERFTTDTTDLSLAGFAQSQYLLHLEETVLNGKIAKQALVDAAGSFSGDSPDDFPMFTWYRQRVCSIFFAPCRRNSRTTTRTPG